MKTRPVVSNIIKSSEGNASDCTLCDGLSSMQVVVDNESFLVSVKKGCSKICPYKCTSRICEISAV